MDRPVSRFKNKMLPVMYANYYLILSEVAHDNGYALALHGSLINDLDLIAVAWTKTRSTADELVRAMCIRLGVIDAETVMSLAHVSVSDRPWCKTYTFGVDGGGYVDLNVVDGELEESNEHA